MKPATSVAGLDRFVQSPKFNLVSLDKEIGLGVKAQ